MGVYVKESSAVQKVSYGPELILIKQLSQDNISIGASTNLSLNFTSAAKIEGYKRDVSYVACSNASSSGVAASFVFCYRVLYYDDYVQVGLRNFYTSAAKVVVELRIRYISNDICTYYA